MVATLQQIAPGEATLAFPDAPEIYFLSGLSPYNSSGGESEPGVLDSRRLLGLFLVHDLTVK